MDVFNELLETIKINSINNKAAIENVELFVNSWQKEKELQLCKTPVMRSLPIDNILGLDQPWSLKDVLSKLIEASNILLHDKNYDGHGWELISHAVDRAKEINAMFDNNDA